MSHLSDRPGEPRPEPRLVRDVAETEELAAEWIRFMGWPGAMATNLSGDSGIDVLGTSALHGVVVAQVKFEAKPTGRPAIQGLLGAGHGVGADHFMFFSSAGYTQKAFDWATDMGIGLFRFSRDGSIEAENGSGESYMRGVMPDNDPTAEN